MGMREVIDFFKQKGGFNSDPLLAKAAGVDPRRLEHAIQRGSQLSATEEAALAKAAGIEPLKGIAMIERAYGSKLADIWANFRKPLNATNRGRLSKA